MSKETLKEQIYNRILEEIINKKYPVDYILKEKELAERFGISKAPVREALIELSMENVVKSIPRAGYMIVRFTEKDISEATSMRLLLEIPVLDSVIDNMTPALMSSLRKDVDKFARENEVKQVPMGEWWNDNISFHVALNAVSGNKLLNETLASVLKRLWRIIAQLFWSGKPTDYITIDPYAHRNLLDAIEQKDRKKAKELLLEDILSIKSQMKYPNQNWTIPRMDSEAVNGFI